MELYRLTDNLFIGKCWRYCIISASSGPHLGKSNDWQTFFQHINASDVYRLFFFGSSNSSYMAYTDHTTKEPLQGSIGCGPRPPFRRALGLVVCGLVGTRGSIDSFHTQPKRTLSSFQPNHTG